MSETDVIADGFGFPESTRWHEGRIWICNWGGGEVLALTADGEREVVARAAAQALPLSIDWLSDGRLLVVDGPRRLLLVQEATGGLEVFADLTTIGEGPFNELVVDRAGNAYVNGGGGKVVLVARDGSPHEVADGLLWPNGMAITDDDQTLLVADSGASQLLAFSVARDGTLSDRRVWAQLEHAPDGICLDADGAAWVATVPGQRCVRVREGGEVLGEVRVDRGCFACMLGGEDGRTMFVGAAVWHGMEAAMTDGPGQTGQLLAAPGQPASHAGRP